MKETKKILSQLKAVVRRFRPAARGELDGIEARLQQRIDAVLCKLDVDPSTVNEWLEFKMSDQYARAYISREPLVSICISTYNRSNLLMERSLKSALSQSYKNTEVIVIGDHCTDDTMDRLGSVRDHRLIFENLSTKGHLPDHPEFRWMAMGQIARNRALALSSGQWITHLDDDDEYLPDRIEKLILLAQERKADVLYHPYFYECRKGTWVLKPAIGFQMGNVTTGSIFYHHWLKNILWDERAWTSHEPGDWNRFRKFTYLKANIQRCDIPLLKHYMEGGFRRQS